MHDHLNIPCELSHECTCAALARVLDAIQTRAPKDHARLVQRIAVIRAQAGPEPIRFVPPAPPRIWTGSGELRVRVPLRAEALIARALGEACLHPGDLQGCWKGAPETVRVIVACRVALRWGFHPRALRRVWEVVRPDGSVWRYRADDQFRICFVDARDPSGVLIDWAGKRAGRAPPQIPECEPEPPVVPLKPPTWKLVREHFTVWWSGQRNDPPLSGYDAQSPLATASEKFDFCEEDAV